MAPGAFVATELTGGNGGDWFDHYTGKPVKAIYVWSVTGALGGIELEFADGQKRLAGRKIGSQRSCRIEDGENITNMTVWGNGAGTRFGALRIRTNKGDTWQAQMQQWGLKTAYNQDAYVGSGILMGFFGRAGWEIDCCGFYFLRKPISVRLINVRYNLSASDLNMVARQITRDFDIDNRRSKVWNKQEFTHQVTRRTHRKWSMEVKENFGVELSVSAKVPDLGLGVDSKVTCSLSTAVCNGLEETHEDVRTHRETIEVPPGVWYRCRAEVLELSCRTTFSGDLEVVTDNHHTHSWPVSGAFSSLDSTRVRVRTW